MISFCCLLFSFGLQAQVKSGKKYLAKKDYEAALNAFTLDLDNKKKVAEASFYLSKLYLEKDFEERSTLKAQEYSQKAIDNLKQLNPKELDKLRKEGIGNLTLQKIQSDIAFLAFDEAMKKDDVALLDEFLKSYPAQISVQTEQISNKRNHLAFQSAQKENSWTAYYAFYSRYHKNAEKYSPKVDSLAKLELFESYVRQNGWFSYGLFAKDYPDNPYVKDSAVAVKFILITQRNTWEDYETFYINYPKSIFNRIGVDSLLRQAERSQRIELFDFWVRNFPEHHAAKRAWKGLYQLFKVKSREEEFKSNYPNCPLKPEELY